MGNSPSVPYNAQLDQVHVALRCFSDDSTRFPITTDFKLSLTAPLGGGSGQQAYYSDVHPVLDYGSSYDPTAYSANVTIGIENSQASPSVLYARGPAELVRGDATGGFVAGPVVLGTSGAINRFSIGVVNITLTPKQPNQLTVRLTCPPAANKPIIGSTLIDSSTGVQRPSTGSTGGQPDTPLGFKSVNANPRVSCKIGDVTEKFNFTFSAVSPAALASGQKFNITSLTSAIIVPNDVVRSLASRVGTSGKLRISVILGVDNLLRRGATGFGLAAINASPTFRDVAYEFTPTDTSTTKPLSGYTDTTVDTTNDIVVALPRSGSVGVDAFTAESGIFSSRLNVLSGIVTGARDSSVQDTYGSVQFSCTVDGDEVFSAPIA